MRKYVFLVIFVATRICIAFAESMAKAEARDLNSKGFSLYQQGKLKEAKVFFEQAIAKDADYAMAHYNLACIIARTVGPCPSFEDESAGDWRSIFPHLAKAIKLDPKRRDRMKKDPDFNQIRKLPEYLILSGLSLRKSEDVRQIVLGSDWCNSVSDFGRCMESLIFSSDGKFVLTGDPNSGGVLKGTFEIHQNEITIHFEKPYKGIPTSKGILNENGRIFFEGPVSGYGFFDMTWVCAG